MRELASYASIASLILNMDEASLRSKQVNPVDITRRHFFHRASTGVGIAALASLLDRDAKAERGLPGFPNFPPKAKRVIYLFQHGAPSQLDLFDYKPGLTAQRGQDLPDSVRMGQRLTGMTAYQAKFPTAPSVFKFAKYGESGMALSELLPYTGKIADQICLVKSLQTDAINHDPAVTFFQTGFQIAGRPSIGAWISYGLGSENNDLPAFVVMVSQGGGNSQALADRHVGQWVFADEIRGGQIPVGHGCGALSFQSRRIRFGHAPALSGRSREAESPGGAGLSGPGDLHAHRAVRAGLSHAKLGAGVDGFVQGTHAMFWRCMARTSASQVICRELRPGAAARGTRRPLHPAFPSRLGPAQQSAERDSRPVPADRSAVRGAGPGSEAAGHAGRHTGGVGRRVRAHGLFARRALTETNYGRDHHPRCFSIWMAGGGIKGGMTYGETDDFSYNVVRDPMDIHDLHATILHCLGTDHTQLTYKFQGRRFRLTDVKGNVVKALLA